MKFFFITLIFIPQIVLAAAEVLSITGVSVYDDSTTPPEIWGGLGGSNCETDAESDEKTCNSCDEDTLAVCNTQRVYPNLKIRIEFKDEDSEGKTLVKETTKNVVVTLDSETTTDDNSVSAGNNHAALITWSTLCSILNENDSGCANSFSGKLSIGTSDDGSDFKGTTQDITIKLVNPSEAGNTVDTCDNATRGICNFTAYPGDEKIYLEDLESKGNFPNDSNAQFKYFRLIYSTETFASDTLNPREAIDAGNFTDVKILEGDSNTEPDLEDDTVDGLDNDQLYYFRGMLVDQANNIMDITANSVYTSDSDCNSNTANEPSNIFACPLTAKPDQVIGLLADDFNCFISTVAYGSHLAPKVNDFRKFRRKFLLPYSWGRALNRAYYKYGSVLSQEIAKSEVARSLARILLFPVWLFAKASLKFGLLKTVLFALLGAIGLWGSLLFLSFHWRRSWVKILLLSFAMLPMVSQESEAQEVVEPKMRNSLPSSKYDNPTNREIRVPHPNAKKGLTRITSDKVYLYETHESPKTGNMSFKLGMYDPQELEGEEKPGTGKNTQFTEIYESADSPMILIDFEWKWSGFLGELNLQLGTGLYMTQGNGVFESDPDSNPARERFTFVAVPFTGSALYKLRFSENQWIIPYGGGGIGVMGFTELRDDNAGPKFGGALIAPLFGGGALSINAIAPKTARALDREYGINTALFAVEYRQLIGLSDKYDFTGEIINAGLMLEY